MLLRVLRVPMINTIRLTTHNRYMQCGDPVCDGGRLLSLILQFIKCRKLLHASVVTIKKRGI